MTGQTIQRRYANAGIIVTFDQPYNETVLSVAVPAVCEQIPELPLIIVSVACLNCRLEFTGSELHFRMVKFAQPVLAKRLMVTMLHHLLPSALAAQSAHIGFEIGIGGCAIIIVG
ncbi:MAG: hypothetical protein E5X64_35090 [Mesorhizobium sp.]|nr:MAG: hypothetical protein E5X64_35090 [Mesorhizobium sp.]